MSVGRELVEAVKIMVARESGGLHTPDGWEDWAEDDVITLASRPAGMVYVNVYRLDRVCGGQEEGGWWYDTGDVELSIACESEESAEHYAEMLGETYVNHGNRYSVIYYRKAPDFEIQVDEKPAADWPSVTPHYE